MSSDRAHEVAEDRQSLWLLTVSPAIWAAHFLVSYIGAAMWCNIARQHAGSGLDAMRVVIVALAVVALIGIGITGRIGWRKHTYTPHLSPPHDQDTPEDRHRFLGYATVLLSALSAIATVYVAIVALFIGSCV
jgi:hypothetical protein